MITPCGLKRPCFKTSPSKLIEELKEGIYFTSYCYEYCVREYLSWIEKVVESNGLRLEITWEGDAYLLTVVPKEKEDVEEEKIRIDDILVPRI